MSPSPAMHIVDAYFQEEDEYHVCKVALSVLRSFHTQPFGDDVTPWAHEWSVEEDRLLVRCDQSQFCDADWLEEYGTCAAQHPRVFGKPLGISPFRERLIALKAGFVCGARYRILLRCEAADAAAGSGRCAKMSPQFAAYARMWKGQDVPQDVALVCDDGAVVTGNAKQLAACSRRMAASLAELRKRGVGSGAAGAAAPAFRLPLSKSHCALPDCDAFGAFSAESVKRFVDASTKPDWARERRTLCEALQAARARQEAAVAEERAELDEKRAEAAQRLAAMRDKELKDLESACGACMEADLRAVASAYKVHVRREEEKIVRRYEKRAGDVQEYYEAQAAAVAALHARFDDAVAEAQTLQEQLRILDASMAAAYTPATVPRLLILAEVLQAGTLRELLLDRVAEDPLGYLCEAQELGCQLIPSATLLELVSRLDTAVVAQLASRSSEQQPSGAVRRSYFEKELGVRRAAFAECLRRMPHGEVAALVGAEGGEACVFAEDVDAEHRARKAGRAVKVKVRMVQGGGGGAPATVISPSGLSVELLQHGRYACVLASHGRSSGDSWGCCYWEAAVDCMDRLAGATCAVGFQATSAGVGVGAAEGSSTGASGAPAAAAAAAATEEEALQAYGEGLLRGTQEELVGLCAGEGGGYGCVLTSDGMVYGNGCAEEAAVAGYGRDDVVGVLLDQEAGRVHFYVNGEPASRAAGTPLSVADNGSLTPCVVLFSACATQKVKLTLAFAKPFKHAPPKALPYSL